ncbi:hypothetical protein I4U23_022470 [Adineta vaga]|nr:hypothetical protein I4U23_022470 [Adineta vaga]
MTDSTIKHITTVFPVNVEALKPNLQISRRRSIIREFSLNTTAHGIPGIARSKSIPNRIFWTISTIAFTGILLYFIIQSIKGYFSYPSQTLLGPYEEWPQIFPAVTICNYSPLRLDLFIGPFLNYTRSLNLTQSNDTTKITRIQASYIRDFFQYKLNRGETLNEYFFSLDSMLISCVYNRQNCSTDDFTPILSDLYGLCYTFNAKNKQIRNGSLFSISDNGALGLLSLQLYTHSHQYVPYFSDASGIAGAVHDNAEIPLVLQSETFFGPGKKHRASFNKEKYVFLGPPYAECRDDIPPMLQSTYHLFSNADYTYSPYQYFYVCMQTYTYLTCGCLNPDFWSMKYIVLSNSTEPITTVPLCNVTDSCYKEAIDRFQLTSEIWDIYCPKQISKCSSTKFTTRFSSLTAPSPWLMDDIKAFVNSSNVPLPENWEQTWRTEIQNSYVAIDFACESLMVESFEQSESITFVDLISTIGGHTGLWIGISFLSLMEIIEMTYRLIRHHCLLLQRRIQGEYNIHL